MHAPFSARSPTHPPTHTAPPFASILPPKHHRVLTRSCARNVQTMRLLSAAEDTSCFMSGEYDTPVTSAPRPRKVRSSSGSTARKDGDGDDEERGPAAPLLWPLPLAALRLVLAVDSWEEPPAFRRRKLGWGGLAREVREGMEVVAAGRSVDRQTASLFTPRVIMHTPAGLSRVDAWCGGMQC